MPLSQRGPILLVEDDTPSAELITILLKGIGVREVDRAADGLDAWTLLQHKSYDLLISDVRMTPVDGLTFLHSLRAEPQFASVRVLLITASRDPAVLRRAKALGADGFLLKPFTADSLQAALAWILPDRETAAA